jgi:superfamily II DNA or RNA helicase
VPFVPPIVLSARVVPGLDATDPEVLVTPSVVLEPVVNPVLVAALNDAGASRRGAASWSYSLAEGQGLARIDHSPLVAVASLCRPSLVHAGETTTDTGLTRVIHRRNHRSYLLTNAVDRLPQLPGAVREAILNPNGTNHHGFAGGAAAFGVVTLEVERSTAWLRVHTNGFVLDPEEDYRVAAAGYTEKLSFDLRPAGRVVKDAPVLTGSEAVRRILLLGELGLPVVDHDPHARTLSSPRGARAFVRSVVSDPDAVLADPDLLLPLVALLSRAELAKLLKVEPERVAAAHARTRNVARTLIHTAEHAVAVAPEAGRPARARVHIGRRVPAPVRRAFKLRSGAGPALAGGRFTSFEVGAEAVGRFAKSRSTSLAPTYIAPQALDVARMAISEPHDDPRLFGYQQEAVGRFLATERGMGNLSAPGAGKTPMTLVGLSAAAKAKAEKGETRYTALVVCEANTRFQWADHARDWFGDAVVVVIDSRKQLDRLRAALAGAEDEDAPLLVISSYALVADVADYVDALSAHERAKVALNRARAAYLDADKRRQGARASTPEERAELHAAALTCEQEVDAAFEAIPDPAEHLGAALAQVRFDDVVADEAVGLRGSSKTGRALWAVRERAGRGLVLTGTPITRDVDDVARLLSWAFGDRRAWYGVKPSDLYDLSNPTSAAQLLRDLGPTVFRIDKSELDVELPTLEVSVVPLKLTPEELTLAETARHQLRETYQELVAYLDVVAAQAEAAGDETTDELKAAREELRAAKGLWLGSVTLARQAAADPVALLDSQTAGARLLASQGLIQAATRRPGTKHTWTAELVLDRIRAGKQVLIFTEFSRVARSLIEAVRDGIAADPELCVAHPDVDVAVGEVLGGGGAARDAWVRSFSEGPTRVLVASSAGERGLNLQAADVLVQYDLPWTASGLVQRTGRVERIGAKADTIEVVFPIASGTIEDRVAGLVCARAMASLQALDVPRGIDVARTDVGRALGDLACHIDLSALRGSEQALLEMTRVLLSGEETTQARAA